MATRNASEFAKGDRVQFNRANDGTLVKGKVSEIDAKADKVTITTDEGKAFKVKAEKVAKMRGRKALTDEEKAEEAAPKKNRFALATAKNGKAKRPAMEDADEEIVG